MKKSNSFSKYKNYVYLNSKINMESVSTSKGNQLKWIDDEYWYKANMMGYENVAEVIVSILCSCIDNLDYVKYDLCKVNNGVREYDCCVSKDFLGNNEFISFHKLLRAFGVPPRKFQKLPPVSRLQTMLKLNELISMEDILDYLNKIVYLDALILNEDRHLNNLGFLKNPKGEFKSCPIFDNGLSLLSDTGDYPFKLSLMDNITRVKAKPFSDDFDIQVRLIQNNYDCKPLRLELKKFYELVDSYDFSNYEKELERCLDVLDYTFNKWEGKIWIQE